MTSYSFFQSAADTVVATLLLSCISWPHAALAQTPAPSGTVITVAGTGGADYGGDNGPAINAVFNTMESVAVGRDGTLYIADNGNHRIRAVDPRTGFVRTVAGTGQSPTVNNGNYTGPATGVDLNTLTSIAVDRSRHVLYVSDVNYNWVRRMNLADGMIGPYAGTGTIGTTGDGGPALLARLRRPTGLAVDGAGRLLIINSSAFRIRQVDPLSTIISHFAGTGNSLYEGDNGPAATASIANLSRLTADAAGNVYFRDGDPNGTFFTVRRVDAVTGIVTTVAGGGANPPGTGLATDMNFEVIHDVAMGRAGEVFISTNFQVFRLEVATGQIAPVAGTGVQGFSGDGGPALAAKFDAIVGIAVLPGGGLILIDANNFRIRYVAPASINLTGDNSLTEFYLPWVGSLSGDLIFTHNTNTGVVNLAGLDSVGGTLALNENTSAGVVNLAGLDVVGGSLSLNDNASAGVVNLAELDVVGGSLSLNDNTTAGEVDISELNTVGGSVEVNGNTSAGEVDLGELNSVGGSLALSDNTSAAAVDLGSLTDVEGDVTIENNASNVQVDLSSLTTYGCGAIPVTMKFNGGTILFPAGLTLCVNATLTGSTTLQGNLTNRGRIEPGSSPGRLNISGDLTLAGESRLWLETGGFAAGQYDVVSVTGAATLGGTVSIKLLTPFPGAVPAGTSLTMLSAAGALTGAFSNAASGTMLTTADGYAHGTLRYAGENTVRLTDIAIVDTDSDTMPDWWEDDSGLNKTSGTDAGGDADGDDASNLQEWIAGTDPAHAGSLLQFLSVSRGPGGISFTVSSSALREYTLERSTDLTSPFATVETKAGTGGEVVFIDTAPPAARCFYRVRARIPTS